MGDQEAVWGVLLSVSNTTVPWAPPGLAEALAKGVCQGELEMIRNRALLQC